MQQVVVEITDDLDGSKAAETLKFGLDGHVYEIDLSRKNASGLRKIVTRYADAGRKVHPGRAKRNMSTRRRSADIRAWARDMGIAVNERGRIPLEVVGQYEAVHAA